MYDTYYRVENMSLTGSAADNSTLLVSIKGAGHED
jgi:hypothetical protein